MQTETETNQNNSSEIIECESSDDNIDIPSSTQFPYYLTRRNSGRSLRSFRYHERREPNIIRRLLLKNGNSTIHRKKTSDHRFRYLRDLGNTLINTRWEWTVVTLASLFFATWLFFACMWMLIGRSNDDGYEDKSSSAPCLAGIRGFMGYFLFSVETQSTVGYGERIITNNCPEAIILLCVQMVFGSGLCGALVSVVYAKMVSPQKMRPGACFSKRAVVCERDGDLCLIFRIRDICNHYQVGTKVCAYVVKNRSEEPYLKKIKLEPISLLIWPIEVIHKINHTSPFYDLSAKDLILKRFEMIVTMEGICGATGRASKTRTSYMSTEIRWGCRFVPCVKYTKGHYFVDHTQFNSTVEHLTPLCSAKRLLEVVHEIGLNRQLEAMYTPRAVYSPLLEKHDWSEIEEENEEDLESSSGIGSLLSPLSVRSNKIVTVADVHVENNNNNLVSNGNDDISQEISETVEMRSKKNIVSYPYSKKIPFWRSSSGSSRRSSTIDSIRSSLHNYVQFFTRQTSKNFIETDL